MIAAMSRRVLLSSVVAGMLAAAPSTFGATQVKAAGWGASADAICKKYVRELDRLAEPKTQKELIVYLQRVLELLDLEGEGGLRNRAKISRASEMAGLGQSLEITQLAQCQIIHK